MDTQLDRLWQQVRTRFPPIPPARSDLLRQALWFRQRQLSSPAEAALRSHGPRRLGLVLGGGGGKGGAHLGVLSVLEELDVPIDLIVGTSIGGAVGILYAAGLDLDTIEQAFRACALRRIVTADPTRSGFIGMRKREAVLRKLLGDCTFADLRIPCAVVAVDLVSGHQVVIDQGPLVQAILATTALPGVFPPVARDQELLADGGILNNVPVDVAERMGAQRVIAVQLVASGQEPALTVAVPENPLARLLLAPRQFAIANRALMLMVARMTEMHLAQHPPALLLRPAVDHIATLDMTHPEDGRRAGGATARAALDALLELKAWRLARDEAPQPAVQLDTARRSFYRWRTALLPARRAQRQEDWISGT